MYKKYINTGIILLLSIGQVFSQDTSRNIRNSEATLISFTDPNPDSARIGRNMDKPHAEINLNMGTSVPGTTSGTLGSSVNPSSGFVIPFGSKKKPDSK